MSDASQTNLSLQDELILAADKALKTLCSSRKIPNQSSPAQAIDEASLDDKEKRLSAALMRVNHTGEVCAQALYEGQALTAREHSIKQQLRNASKEEWDHLCWCQQRLDELNHRTSVLNPAFYASSFVLGAATSLISDKISLGFVAATEELVSEHLESHLERLPEHDQRSRAIVLTMLDDERQHQQAALDSGGNEFPAPIKFGMKLLSKAMTFTTHRV